ncbi:glycoside hydrolase family 43 protein [Paenibacillus sp. MMS20-IR301]|uniref:glycoside hydrolase family 43 protein n=1 Tax=Paenibacillus sp. MMS20-IR301 TaxID=2895946 RepID=UPI0028EE6626|nr:glycoside hydrolase family 43 protein [Paenibacillus sp. MMS20-IR301]WNS44083.1 glycoside hydrolase family 43 protein [Paenibacillus sp. MMS20-IR301]
MQSLDKLNPVISGYYPDPSVVRVEEDYYLVNSSFEYFPGVPIFHSRDLLHWTPLGHVLTRQSQADLRTSSSSDGIYAATLRYHAGRFYMITTDVRGIGNFYVTAEQPGGPWSDPVLLPHGGIDPSLFFDEDGRAYVTVQNGAGLESHIIQYEIDPATGKVLTEPVRIWNGDEGPWVEGPHLYKIKGLYYLMTASGGTGSRHREIIARSSTPYGPFEDKPEPILTHNGLQEHPVQCLGHADLVEDVSGNWWAVFLGTRPIDGKYAPLGRETFLAPVTWTEDGWPVIDNNEGTVVSAPDANAACAESRQGAGLQGGFGPEWAFLRSYEEERYSWTERAGWLAVRGNRYTLEDEAPAVFACIRQKHHRMEMAVSLDFIPAKDGEYAGLAARLNNRGYLFWGLGRAEGKRIAQLLVRDGDQQQVHTYGLSSQEAVALRLRCDGEYYSCAYSADGVLWHEAEHRVHVRSLSPEVNGGFTGVCLGLHATGTGADSTAVAYYEGFCYRPL